MNLRKLLIPVLVSVALGTVCDPAPAFADFSAKDWKTAREIVLPNTSGQEYVRLKLDNKVAGSGKDFRDVRVIDSAGREVPYQLVVEDASIKSGFYPSTVLDRGSSAGGLRFVIDLEKSGLLHNRLEIVSSSKDYRRQVSVFAGNTNSSNAAAWNLLNNQGYIYKITNPSTGRFASKGTVDYPQSTARYLLVVIENGPEGVLALDSANVYTYEVSSAKEEQTTISATVLQNTNEQSTELTADLGTSGIPTRKVTLNVTMGENAQLNFNRTVRVFGSDTNENWTLIGSGYISRLVTPKFTGTSMTIEYPESRYRYYKIAVLNFDDTPLPLNASLTFTQVIRTIVFEAPENTSYTLYYGNDKAFAPTYDISRFFSYLDSTAFPQASLGAERANPSYVPPIAPVVPFSEAHPAVLNTILALLVVVIGGLIFFYVWKVARKNKISAIPPSTSPSDNNPQPPVSEV